MELLTGDLFSCIIKSAQLIKPYRLICSCANSVSVKYSSSHINWMVLFFTHLLLAGLEPVGEEGCSGSRFTRQVGNEQPSPKL